jgi:hypothetical protein
MSMLTMFFAAPAAELQSQDLSKGVPAAFPSEQSNVIDEMKVAGLENILTGRDPSEAMRALMNHCVYSHDESGITVLQMSDELVKALASLTPETATDPAKRWLLSDPWHGFGQREEDLLDMAELLASIGKLATAALVPGHGLYFWVCP